MGPMESYMNIMASNTLVSIKVDLEKMNCSSTRNLTQAAHANTHGEELYGYVGGKINASVAFASAAVCAVVSAVADAFLTLIALPFCIFSDKAQNFANIHLHHTCYDLAAIFIGAVGTVSPGFGSELFRDLMKQNQVLQLDMGINSNPCPIQ